MRQLSLSIAHVCEHVRMSNSIEDYIDPRIIYSFLVDNGLMDMEPLFFQPQQREKHAWAHPRNYSYASFIRYKVITILFD